MNFGDIKKRIHLITNTDKGLLVDDWIRSGQRYLEDSLRIRAMEYFPTPTNMDVGTLEIAIPSDYLELIFLAIIYNNQRTVLSDRISMHAYTELVTNIAVTNTGKPSTFARFGNTFRFDKYTDKIYKYEIGYLRRLSALTVAADTNWWTESAYDALFYASLVEAYPMLISVEPGHFDESGVLFTVWVEKRKEELGKLRKTNTQERLSGNINDTALGAV